MGEMGEIFREMTRQKKERKYHRKVKALHLLKENHVVYEELNNGYQLRINVDKDVVIDYWPTTGRWIIRNKKACFGVYSLLKFLRRKK